jgi:hypothetical protein
MFCGNYSSLGSCTKPGDTTDYGLSGTSGLGESLRLKPLRRSCRFPSVVHFLTVLHHPTKKHRAASQVMNVR